MCCIEYGLGALSNSFFEWQPNPNGMYPFQFDLLFCKNQIDNFEIILTMIVDCLTKFFGRCIEFSIDNDKYICVICLNLNIVFTNGEFRFINLFTFNSYSVSAISKNIYETKSICILLQSNYNESIDSESHSVIVKKNSRVGLHHQYYN